MCGPKYLYVKKLYITTHTHTHTHTHTYTHTHARARAHIVFVLNFKNENKRIESYYIAHSCIHKTAHGAYKYKAKKLSFCILEYNVHHAYK
jgi:hypothetical protein